MALADPDLPSGIEAPEMNADPPPGVDADRYRGLRDAFNAMPRRSRVVVALRMPQPGRRPLTFRAISRLFGISHERIRQLEARAVWELSSAWHEQKATGIPLRERVVDLSPIVGAAIGRYPIDNGDSDERWR
jgi:hypothetical protein